MKKILIVDDNRELVQLVKYRLEANQYVVIDAYDGEEGITCALEHKPDLIIMDVQMPKVPGIEAVRRLRAKTETKDIPIIFLTGLMGQLTDGEQHKSVCIDGIDFLALPKPFNADHLLEVIKHVIHA